MHIQPNDSGADKANHVFIYERQWCNMNLDYSSIRRGVDFTIHGNELSDKNESRVIVISWPLMPSTPRTACWFGFPKSNEWALCMQGVRVCLMLFFFLTDCKSM